MSKASTGNGYEPTVLPAPQGNRRAVSHGAFARFTPAELAEVAALEDTVRALCPIESESVEPAVSVLAGLLWRRAKLYSYLDTHGLHRGRADRVQLQPGLEALASIERQVIETMKVLAMTPAKASELKLSLVRLERESRIDLSRLDEAELETFTALARKAESAGEEWSD